MSLTLTSGWGASLPALSLEDRTRIIDEVSAQFQGLSLSEMRGDREKLVARALPLVNAYLSRTGLQATLDEINSVAREVIARVGGLGFLEPLLRTDSGLSEVTLTPHGDVWILKKGAPSFEKLPSKPNMTEAWRAVGPCWRRLEER